MLFFALAVIAQLTRDAVSALLDNVASLEDHALVERVVVGIRVGGVEVAVVLSLALELAPVLVTAVEEADLPQRQFVHGAHAGEGAAHFLLRMRGKDRDGQDREGQQQQVLHIVLSRILLCKSCYVLIYSVGIQMKCG